MLLGKYHRTAGLTSPVKYFVVNIFWNWHDLFVDIFYWKHFLKLRFIGKSPDPSWHEWLGVVGHLQHQLEEHHWDCRNETAGSEYFFVLGLELKKGVIFCPDRMPYEAVSDQGPVWVRSEDKIPSGFESTPSIIFSMPRYSLVTQLSKKVWHVHSQN